MPVTQTEHDDGAGARKDEIGCRPLVGGSLHPLHVGLHPVREPAVEGGRFVRQGGRGRDSRETHVIETQRLEPVPEILLVGIHPVCFARTKSVASRRQARMTWLAMSLSGRPSVRIKVPDWR